MTNGAVYFWPDNEATRACIANPTAGCTYLRQQVPNAKFNSNGYVTFAVGARYEMCLVAIDWFSHRFSVTQPAGGYYQVSAGNDIALIVGVTAACVCIVLAVVASAIYFRRHPAAWATFKAWFVCV